MTTRVIAQDVYLNTASHGVVHLTAGTAEADVPTWLLDEKAQRQVQPVLNQVVVTPRSPPRQPPLGGRVSTVVRRRRSRSLDDAARGARAVGEGWRDPL